MRIAAAMALCLTGGTACFIAVLQLMDAGSPARETTLPVAEPTAVVSAPVRLTAFAAPALAGRNPAAIDRAEPAKASMVAGLERSRLPAFVAPGVLVASALAPQSTAVAMKDAIVPPIVRRRPPRDVADDETVTTPAPTAVAEAKPTTPKKVAKTPVRRIASTETKPAAPAPAAATARRPFDTSTRSALGGPRPAR